MEVVGAGGVVAQRQVHTRRAHLLLEDLQGNNAQGKITLNTKPYVDIKYLLPNIITMYCMRENSFYSENVNIQEYLRPVVKFTEICKRLSIIVNVRNDYERLEIFVNF